MYQIEHKKRNLLPFNGLLKTLIDY